MILLTAGLVVTKNNQLLLAYSNNKNAWYLPGGKVDKGETPKEALIREIREELNIDLQPDKIESYKHISAPAYGESPELIMEQDTFRYDLTEKIQPSHEIAAVKFFDLEMYKQEPAQVPGVLKVFALLKEDDIIL
ncbi:8-oxo-dGTP pyrophosphatase MutT (NUDIX family) [Dysgonomonas hofstadii]|uniref:8-oxo-dGTP pyrophosphatase MutT (NUDIX family) n=1 Tax=Dysgonomonas hofstadii TaxID=637886 RepID=A0A840CLC9_9BACT|nr:NUDIX domain-containing protein [Dysgonomonas hofstadii]MBB4036867.1 8-oxo-dGTP pyrophosphatase MutT (NUDIX family) [Dysgonomonas hofstadii]